MREYEILDLIEETADIIAERHGMNVSYCESMDMTLFPVVVETMLGNEQENDIDDLHFLATNGRLIPEEYKESTIEEIRAYLLEHKDEILNEIESDCRSYQSDYADVDPEDYVEHFYVDDIKFIPED